jgi:DNA-binding NarL/FixJ family response regulator
MDLPRNTSTPRVAAAPDEFDSLLPGPVLVVEDEPLAQARLRDVLVSLSYAEDALVFTDRVASARALFIEQAFAIALIDIGLPDGSGIELIRLLHERDPALPILVVSTWSTERAIVTALQAGATGYVLKERDELEISLSIRSALRGGAPIDPFIARHILALIEMSPSPPTASQKTRSPILSPREVEILTLVSKGLTNREIADVLSLSRLTVGCHIKNIYKKLAVNSRTQAIFEARSQGLLF